MKVLLLCAVSLVAVALCAGWKFDNYGQEYVDKLMRISSKIYTDPKWQKEWQRNVEIFGDEELPPVDFTCNTDWSPAEPSNIHELRPVDVDLIASFGDSILAGNGLGASNIFELAIQNRGEAFTVGGGDNIFGNDLIEDNVVTLATILRQFNHDLEGWSYGTGWQNDPNAGLNVAVPGARSVNMPAQADNMVAKMQENMDSFNNDWKVVSLFVGGNDLCQSCWFPDPEGYMATIRDALDTLHAEVPRAFVNLIVMFDVSPLEDLSTGWMCDMLHGMFCSCAIDPDTKPGMRQLQLDYYQQLKDLVDSGRYDTRDDFTVVLQPHMRDLLPIYDDEGVAEKEWFSPDCFHPGRKLHQAMAIILWNAMLQPVGQKDYDPDYANPYYECPTEEQPYFFTSQNSGLRR